MTHKKKFWDQPWLLSAAAAVFLFLSFPPYSVSILQIPAFVFLFRIIVMSVSFRQMFIYTYPALVIWNLANTYWLMMADIAAGVAAILANSLIMLIPLALAQKFLAEKRNPVLLALFAASAWVGYEFLHHRWDLAWPWLTLGNGWSNLTGVIQYISFTGILGISFWVVFTAALIYKFIDLDSRQSLYGAIIVFFAFPVFSVISMVTTLPKNGEPLEVVIVQPNSDSYAPYGGHNSTNELIDWLLYLSDSARTENTDLILWPENALKTTVPLSSAITNRISDSLKVWNTTLVTGTGYQKFYEEGEEPNITRKNHRQEPFNIFNTAFFLAPDKPTVTYEKGRLVPVVERFPFADFIYKLDRFGWINWDTIAGYGLGTEATVFHLNGGSFPALICYDSVFPQWVNRFMENDPDFLTIITNDGWWGDSHGHIQHFAYARLRAIEHRRWIARSANNGISGVISPDGKVQHQTEYWTDDAFSFTIYRSDQKTFYTRNGDWIGYLMLFTAIGGFIFIRYKNESD